ncbi:MAG TPA: glycoside hydrolase family 2 TIM barrel-domain containing protein, partial [Polyangiaceae bacterium]
ATPPDSPQLGTPVGAGSSSGGASYSAAGMLSAGGSTASAAPAGFGGTFGGGSAAAGSDGLAGGGAGPAGAGGMVATGGDAGSSGSGGASTGGSAGSAGAGGASGAAGGAFGPVCPATGLAGAGQVKIIKSGSTFSMTRDGAPMYIKGIAGGSNLPLAQQYGVNSTRIFTSAGASGILDDAKSHCMTVLLGIELSQNPSDYTNTQFTNGKRAEISALLSSIKNHPALLMWALGNEINLGADNQTAWSFVAELAQMIHQGDPNHPVISVLAGANVTAINHIVQWAPSLDAIGVNSYAAVTGVNAAVASSNFMGPVIVTEWGPTGHWECPNTSWARPIEETSGAKSRVYKMRYDSFAHTGRILGDYVFLWGQKIERTPTWYGMFLENNPDLGLKSETLPTVDTMAVAWSGAMLANRAPDVTAITLGGKLATDNVSVTAGQALTAQVTASEPDGDTMSYVWEVLQDPAQPDLKGGPEAREPRVGSPTKGTTPTLNLKAPSQSGQYRLFAYVLDGKGHAGTANIPFRVN